MNKARIFIVEDEIVIVRGLEDALERHQYEVCGFAFSGAEALPLIEKHRPDLVLVDIHLKGEMDGIELARDITSSLGIPVIYITAYSNKEVLDRAKITDPFGYIVKPFRESQLKVCLELALERSLVERKRNEAIANYLQTIEEMERRIHRRTEELDATTEELRKVEWQVEQNKSKVDELRTELREVNQALLTFGRQMEKARGDLELEVAAVIRSRVLPVLRQLESDPHCRKYKFELEMLTVHMSQLSGILSGKADWSTALSTTELRVATFIKKGFTSEAIARELSVSLDTVKTHRKNMRKKLNISNTDTNLSAYLRAGRQAR